MKGAKCWGCIQAHEKISHIHCVPLLVGKCITLYTLAKTFGNECKSVHMKNWFFGIAIQLQIQLVRFVEKSTGFWLIMDNCGITFVFVSSNCWKFPQDNTMSQLAYISTWAKTMKTNSVPLFRINFIDKFKPIFTVKWANFLTLNFFFIEKSNLSNCVTKIYRS